MKWYEGLLTVTVALLVYRWLRGVEGGRAGRDAGMQGPAAGSAESVLGVLERASEAEPENAEIHAGRGRALLETGRHAEALDAIDRAISLDATRPELHAQRARALRLLGRHAEASCALDRVDELALSQGARARAPASGTVYNAPAPPAPTA